MPKVKVPLKKINSTEPDKELEFNFKIGKDDLEPLDDLNYHNIVMELLYNVLGYMKPGQKHDVRWVKIVRIAKDANQLMLTSLK